MSIGHLLYNNNNLLKDFLIIRYNTNDDDEKKEKSTVDISAPSTICLVDLSSGARRNAEVRWLKSKSPILTEISMSRDSQLRAEPKFFEKWRLQTQLSGLEGFLLVVNFRRHINHRATADLNKALKDLNGSVESVKHNVEVEENKYNGSLDVSQRSSSKSAEKATEFGEGELHPELKMYLNPQQEAPEPNIQFDLGDVIEEDTEESEKGSGGTVDPAANAPNTSTASKASVRVKIDQFLQQHHLTPKDNIIWRKNSTYIAPPIQCGYKTDVAGSARVDRFKKPPFSSDSVMKAKGRGPSEEVLSGDGQYKNHALELKVPKKQILDLIHFRAYVAETLIMSNMTPKKRGRPSGSPADSSACSRAGSPSTSSFSPSGVKRLREEFTSVREVRVDNVGHLAEFDEKKNATRLFYYCHQNDKMLVIAQTAPTERENKEEWKQKNKQDNAMNAIGYVCHSRLLLHHHNSTKLKMKQVE
ncbi:hypothetical protein GEV33_000038 [Tenebrio molitor]|uniref:Uncharacterized protein n=1 Tax=Tenebrio molitor TaxID=7067 RepID=A0A8J6HXZ5_TENMO|nr:hypothetical protein GEV33_000038 [Tenebrio molitor]